MKTGFYPGCSMKGSAREYSESLLAVAAALDRELPEIPDWNCCGATAAHNLSRDLSLALPARILAAAEKDGMDEVLVPCAACYSRLSVTRHELLQDEDLRQKISGLIETNYQGSAKVLNIIEWLTSIPDLETKIKTPFARRVACYYGCGAGFSVSRTDLVAKLSGLILDDAVARGAEAVIVACPMCHLNLDLRRPQIEKRAGKKINIPVIYITQALGLALGIAPKKLGLQRHTVAVKFSQSTEGAANVAQSSGSKTLPGEK